MMQREGPSFSRHRIEALSDGVSAIAMTLLVLDLKVPLDVPPGQLAHALRHEGPEWVSFVISFSLLSLYWTYQHRVFERLREFGTQSLALTFAFLGLVSVLPFTTSLWGHHIREPLAFSVYYLNQLGLSLLLLAKIELAARRGHLDAALDRTQLRFRLYGMSAAMASAAAACWLAPLQYAFIGPVGVALTGRILRKRRERRLAALEAQPTSDPRRMLEEVDG